MSQQNRIAWYNEPYGNLKHTVLVDSRLISDDYEADMDMLSHLGEEAAEFMDRNNSYRCHFDLAEPHQRCFIYKVGDTIRVSSEPFDGWKTNTRKGSPATAGKLHSDT